MPSAFQTISTRGEDGVLTITLNRPDNLNAFNDQMCIELSAALRSAQRDRNLRCVVLTGAGRAFCAGQDLAALRQRHDTDDPELPYDLGAVLRQNYNPLMARMRSLEKPIIACVNGPAAGAGSSLAFACDLRLCARSAYFNLAFVKVGLIPDAGATLTLVQHVGYSRAAELCMLGEDLPAEEALAFGLVNRVVDDDLLEVTTSEIALRLATMPTRALGLTKRALNHAARRTLDEQLEYEAYLQQTAGRTDDHREGVAAFLEKRKPRFTGK